MRLQQRTSNVCRIGITVTIILKLQCQNEIFAESATIRGTAYTNYNVKAEEPTATFSFRIQKVSDFRITDLVHIGLF